ncbi:MAG: glutathione S-transferase [Alphaproteobacteria bacterium BRH_c36]|nr:MAG: glutathione S-transferase [Alphaproteobacteria bacterium BRH_c36]
MRTLYVFGPHFGLPDASPFCTKAMVLLKMAGLDYETAICDPRKAPKKKGPYLIDDGGTIADTAFIRWHIEKKYGYDFEYGLSAEQRGIAWAVEKLCEDNIYFATLHERWLVDGNFNAGPRVFFEAIPEPLRFAVIAMVRRQVKRDLWGQGLGRHSRAELVRIGNRGIEAISQVLGDKPFLMGDTPKGVDAMAFATVAGTLCERFETGMLAFAQRRANLVAYRDRCMALWFPEMAGISVQAAE